MIYRCPCNVSSSLLYNRLGRYNDKLYSLVTVINLAVPSLIELYPIGVGLAIWSPLRDNYIHRMLRWKELRGSSSGPGKASGSLHPVRKSGSELMRMRIICGSVRFATTFV